MCVVENERDGQRGRQRCGAGFGHEQRGGQRLYYVCGNCTAYGGRYNVGTLVREGTETICAGHAHAVVLAAGAATSGQPGRSGLRQGREHDDQEHRQNRNGDATPHKYADSST